MNVICPVSNLGRSERITLAHGEGGRLTRRLIEDVIRPRLGTDTSPPNDAAELPAVTGALAFTTDSFVVSPLFFPGGDIGRLSVFGTVNDLAVAGAKPRWLSFSLIIEEGLPIDTLVRIVDSAAQAAREAGVAIVTGDTKVVPKHAADGLFINTSGIGEFLSPAPPGPSRLIPGDEIIVSGPIGRHGLAILAAREQLRFDPAPASDCASLVSPIERLQQAQLPIKAMRDATRGGVTAVLHEWAGACQHSIAIEEERLPMTSEVRGATELLGLDPLHIGNEGVFLVAVPSGWGARTVEVLRQDPQTIQAAVIGQVRDLTIAPVTIRRLLRKESPLDEPSNVLLPRIC